MQNVARVLMETDVVTVERRTEVGRPTHCRTCGEHKVHYIDGECVSCNYSRLHDPTPEQIAAMCEKIQLEWSRQERNRRQGYRRATYDPALELRPIRGMCEEPFGGDE